MSKAKYRTRCRVQRDEKVYLAGSEIVLPEETAERLLAMNPPAIERIADAAASASVRESAQRLNAKDTIKLVKAATTVEALQQIEDAELAHADGARESVIDALEARMAALANAGAEDGDEPDADGDAGEGDEDGA
jgi:hypothetical protein